MFDNFENTPYDHKGETPMVNINALKKLRGKQPALAVRRGIPTGGNIALERVRRKEARAANKAKRAADKKARKERKEQEKQAKAAKGKKKAAKSSEMVDPADDDTSESDSELSVHESDEFSDIDFEYGDEPGAEDDADEDMFTAIEREEMRILQAAEELRAATKRKARRARAKREKKEKRRLNQLEDAEDGGSSDDESDSGQEKAKQSVVRNYVLKLSDGTFPCPSFEVVYCDEAHYLRNKTMTFSRLVQQIPKNGVVMMTATPTLNRIEDIRGLAFQVEKVSNIVLGRFPAWVNWHWLATAWEPFEDEGIYLPVNPRQSTVGQPNEDPATKKAGNMPEAYVPTLDNLEELFTAVFRPKLTLTNGKQLQPYSEEKTEALIEAAKSGNRFWVLHRWATSQIKTLSDNPAESDAVYKEVFKSIVIRRTMTTGIKDPFKPGIMHYPQKHMPSFTAISDGCSYSDEQYKIVAPLLEGLMRMLPTLPADDDEDGPIEGDEGVQSDPREKKDPSRGNINMAADRLLRLGSMDVKSLVLATRRDGLVLRSTDSIDQIVTSICDAAVRIAVKARKANAKAKAEGTPRKGPALGTEEMDQLINLDMDSGLSYYFTATVYDKRCSAPSADRGAMLQYVLADSPILYRTVYLCLANKKRGRRTLVVVYSQVIQQ